MFERFTERARQVVVLAQEEARAFNHDYIGTEHLLLGLLRVEDGPAAKALTSLGVAYDDVRAAVERIVGPGEAEKAAGQIPFTPRAKKVLELSLREALSIGHNHIGTEHILLGLARENGGVAARILVDAGAGADKVRERIFELVGAPRATRPSRMRFGRRTPSEMRPPTQWEYHVERQAVLDGAALNALGDKGWELVGTVRRDEGVDLIFKRQLRALPEVHRAEGA